VKEPKQPIVVISGALYTKLKFMASQYPTEVGYMGILNDEKIIDVWMPTQTCNAAHVSFDMEDYNSQIADLTTEYHPNDVSTIWIHTHPGSSATPSATDEETFSEDFCSEVTLMIIFAADTDEYCRVAFRASTGQSIQQVCKIKVDWDLLDEPLTQGNEPHDWLQEAKERVTQESFKTTKKNTSFSKHKSQKEIEVEEEEEYSNRVGYTNWGGGHPVFSPTDNDEWDEYMAELNFEDELTDSDGRKFI